LTNRLYVNICTYSLCFNIVKLKGQTMKKEKPHYCKHVAEGKLCDECVNNKTCKDTGCPVWRYRRKDVHTNNR